MSERPFEPPSDGAEGMSYAESGDLARVRDFVRASALAFGLPGSRVDLLALAVNELTANALQHTTGGGRVRLWANAGQVVCDVTDAGSARSFGPMPSADAVRGRGLAIVQRVADEVSTITGPEGTLVQVRMNL